MTESQLRSQIRAALREGLDDIRPLRVRLRVRRSDRGGPRVSDLLTDIRGIQNVITVRQDQATQRAPEGRHWLNLRVGFEDDVDWDVPDLERALLALEGVDLVHIEPADE